MTTFWGGGGGRMTYLETGNTLLTYQQSNNAARINFKYTAVASCDILPVFIVRHFLQHFESF